MIKNRYILIALLGLISPFLKAENHPSWTDATALFDQGQTALQQQNGVKNAQAQQSAKNQPAATSKNSCIKRRGAFDVGSGSTKLKVADVDVCSRKVIAVIFEASEKANYEEDLKSSSNGAFSDAMIADGLQIIKKIVADASQYKPQVYFGVATSAFRNAKNARSFLNKVTKETGIPIKIIPQREEATLGFFAATAKTNTALSQAVVWDIGGGSMQMTTLDAKHQLLVYEGNLASVGFKNHIIQNIQKKPASGATPNPLSQSDITTAVQFAQDTALQVPAGIQQKLKASNTTVIGIGGVHYYSVRKQVGQDQYSKAELQKTLMSKAGLADDKIGGKYANTEVSNLALVYGFMEALGINTVSTAKIDMTDGILLHPNYWK